MEDQIDINNFKASCLLGTTLAERTTPQEITLNLTLFLSLKEAGQKDDLSKSVDYAAVLTFLEIFLKNKAFNLIEALAEKSAEAILREFPLRAIEIEAIKTPFKNPKSLSVRIYRQKEAHTDKC